MIEIIFCLCANAHHYISILNNWNIFYALLHFTIFSDSWLPRRSAPTMHEVFQPYTLCIPSLTSCGIIINIVKLPGKIWIFRSVKRVLPFSINESENFCDTFTSVKSFISFAPICKEGLHKSQLGLKMKFLLLC